MILRDISIVKMAVIAMSICCKTANLVLSGSFTGDSTARLMVEIKMQIRIKVSK